MREYRTKTVKKPWGYYTTLYNNENSVVKIIVVYPKQKLSLQKHKHREEFWYVSQGYGMITLSDSCQELKERDYILIPKETIHRVENTSEDTSLIIIELQMGEILDEEDIVRIEDDYGRTSDGI